MKCSSCKKRVGVLVFSCACEKTFCVVCRLPEDHACPAQVKVTVVLPPAVTAPKIEKL
jgi:predicted nucleic acid binding AN1-type Zn finger protein